MANCGASIMQKLWPDSSHYTMTVQFPHRDSFNGVFTFADTSNYAMIGHTVKPSSGASNAPLDCHDVTYSSIGGAKNKHVSTHS